MLCAAAVPEVISCAKVAHDHWIIRKIVERFASAQECDIIQVSVFVVEEHVNLEQKHERVFELLQSIPLPEDIAGFQKGH